ncbi:hypothetical protein ACKS0A_07116 [Histoplasma ohiense]
MSKANGFIITAACIEDDLLGGNLCFVSAACHCACEAERCALEVFLQLCGSTSEDVIAYCQGWGRAKANPCVF